MRIPFLASLLVTCAVSLAATGCGSDGLGGKVAAGSYARQHIQGEGGDVRTARLREKGGTWTILLHMAADNNLYLHGLEDLNQIEAGLPTDGSVQVYVLFDGSVNGDSCIYKIKHDVMNNQIVSEKILPPSVIPSGNEIDCGSAATVDAFVAWAAQNAPADHTFLTFWDHGSGIFRAPEQAPVLKGWGWDDHGSHLLTADLTRITQTFKRIAGKPLAGVGFDACLMGHGELAYQLADRADYFVASEELVPGKGFDYIAWLQAIAASDKTPCAVAKAAVDTFAASYGPGGSQSTGWENITISAIDVRAFVNNVVPALDDFVNVANANMNTYQPLFVATRKKTQEFENHNCADLGNFLTLLQGAVTRESVLSPKIANVLAAYKTAVVREAHSERRYPGATGAVLYFPKDYESVNGAYTDPSRIAFAATSWKSFLQKYRPANISK